MPGPDREGASKKVMGTRPSAIILGVMTAVGLLSMFLSNVSTTLMIIPVVNTIADSMADEGRFPQAGAAGAA